MKNVLITGASGFVGGYLAEHLLSLGGYTLYGTCTSEASRDRSPLKDKIHFIQANLQEKEDVVRVITESTPAYVYHLAAQANVHASFHDPLTTFHANIDSQVHLFEALRDKRLVETRVLVVGSAEEYGKISQEDIPVKETAPLRPASPYAVSKITQDYLALQYHLAYGLPIIRVRPFNHIGSRQKPGFVTADFAKQIALIEQGKQEPVIHVGNLEAKRDFTDVRDMVRAYRLVLEQGKAGDVYNIGSGVAHTIQEVLDMLLASATRNIMVSIDTNKLRPSDIPEIRADSTKVKELTGWEPRIPLKQTLEEILGYWREVSR